MRTRVYLQKELDARLSTLSTAVSYMGGTANVSTGTTDTKFTNVANGIKALKPTITQDNYNPYIISAKCGNGPVSTYTLATGGASISTVWKQNILEITLQQNPGWVAPSTQKPSISISTASTYSATANTPGSTKKKLFSAGDRVYFQHDYYVENMPAGSQSAINATWQKNKLKIFQRNTAGYVPTNEVSATMEIGIVNEEVLYPGQIRRTILMEGQRLYINGDVKVETLGGSARSSDVRVGTTFSSNIAGRNKPGSMYLPAYNTNNRLISKAYQPFDSNGVPGGYFNMERHSPLISRPNEIIVEYKLCNMSNIVFSGATVVKKGIEQPISPNFPDAIWTHIRMMQTFYPILMTQLAVLGGFNCVYGMEIGV